MNTDDLLLSVAVVAVVVSLVGMGFTYYSVDSFKKSWLTGLATDTDIAYVNITIESLTAINFTTRIIDWGSGMVNTGETNATLDTSDNSVVRGNWTNVSQGFVLENIGNTIVNLSLATDKDAGQFIGGNNPLFQYNVTDNEAGSCTAASGFTIADYYNVNTTGIGTNVCTAFYANDTIDTVRIDIRIRVPSDSQTGTLTSIMTATATG